MSTTTQIEWTDATWNPITGCSRVSEGCRHCFVKQLGAHVIQGGERRIKADKTGGDMDEWPHEIRVRQFPEVL